jgi:hypothetical protein
MLACLTHLCARIQSSPVDPACPAAGRARPIGGRRGAARACCLGSRRTPDKPHGRGEKVRAHPDYNVRPRGHRVHDARHRVPDEPDRDAFDARYESLAQPYGRLGHSYDREVERFRDHAHSHHERTREFVSHGRSNAYRRGLSRWRLAAIGAAVAAVVITILAFALSGGGPSWPSSVSVVQNDSARACQNPNVASEPAQVNFACAKDTRQILWIFALMMSGDDPNFADAKTGRMGLEPITPAQGGEVAWSLNLHHPYDPTNAIDSLEVAARAINNIVGGATLTSGNGTPVVQPGLESTAADCVRYTGSAALDSRQGYPSVCALPVASQAGEAALVEDVYLKWNIGAGPEAAQDAAILFQNANNPGDPQVQAILMQLPGAGPAA